jgi:indole-3-glycerol phosphate synthase
MTDFLDILAKDAKTAVEEGYYSFFNSTEHDLVSLKQKILQNNLTPIIAEVKKASPSRGTIRHRFEPKNIALAMVRGGATGISVLTEPKHFRGSLEILHQIRKIVGIPILMKDIVVSSTQLEVASKIGADAILLIQALFDRKYCDCEVSEMVTKAHSNNLEVLLETHNLTEFVKGINSEADLVGINNRNLATLKVDLNTTKNVLTEIPSREKVIVSESGINTIADLNFLKECGAQAFLIGSSIMQSDDVEIKVQEFANAS